MDTGNIRVRRASANTLLSPGSLRPGKLRDVVFWEKLGSLFLLGLERIPQQQLYPNVILVRFWYRSHPKVR